jgi:carbon-monoxide dehydrogenase medium subunit
MEYQRPDNLHDALDALGPDSVVLAGGTDLVTMRAQGSVAGRILLDIKHIPELRGVSRRAGSMEIGATTTMRQLAPTTDAGLQALADGAGVVGAVQTRNRATLGGNVCRSSPAGDTLAPLLVLGTKVQLASRSGDRTVELDDFFVGPGRNVRRVDELVTGFTVPTDGGASAYLRYTYRSWMDLAVVGVAARINMLGSRCTSASLAIAGAAPTPLLVPDAAAALIGSACDPDALERAAQAVQGAANPIDDVRGTRAHRLRALGVLTTRVIRIALERAQSAERVDA